MWPDNETAQDFLNFSGVAKTVSQIILKAEGRPISIGVSGMWGVGKSSMIKLIRKELSAEDTADPKKIVFIEFNAWLYQGYDDARAALMDVIATKLREEAEKRQTAVDKTKDLLKRVNWLRVAKLGATVAGFAAGIPNLAIAAGLAQIGKDALEGQLDKATVGEIKEGAKETATAAEGLIKAKAIQSPPHEIQAMRSAFEEALREMKITLVVLIDDLDRCLPETTISTLEAVRLFLFLKNAAFVVAADTSMIKHAVRKHFDGVDDELVTSYFDKLIQIPIRVPPLGIQEVRAYMFLLFVENSTLGHDTKEIVRTKVCEQLAKSWQGKRVDLAFIQSLELTEKLPANLIARLDTADKLAPALATASQVRGNPRLIKRFLNELSIRTAISHAHGVGVNEAALVKMLLFERCAAPQAYQALAASVASDEKGRPQILAEWEEAAHKCEKLVLTAPWDDPFVVEWLALPPRLANEDLRGVLYVSREHAPLVLPGDRLSTEAAEILGALMEHPDMAANLSARLPNISRPEMAIVMDRLLEKARTETEWGAPPILSACLVLSSHDAIQGQRLSAFLQERPVSQIKASIVPKIADQSWAKDVFAKWKASSVGAPVKAAITLQEKKNGNVAVK